MSKARGLAPMEDRFRVKITKLYAKTAERTRLASALTAKADAKRIRRAIRRKATVMDSIERDAIHREFLERMHALGYRVRHLSDVDAYLVTAPSGKQQMVTVCLIEHARSLSAVVDEIHHALQ